MHKAFSDLASKIEGKSNTCSATAQGELDKINEIDARTAFTNDLIKVTADGELDQNEIAAMQAAFDQANIDPESRRQFLEAFTSSGGAVIQADGQRLTGDQATEALISQLAQVREEIQDTTMELNDVQAQIAALELEQQQVNSELNAAREEASKESGETVEIQEDAAAVSTAMTYSSMSDYVLSNFNHMYMGNREGMSLSDAANDPSKILTHNGESVFVDNETQELYTLQRNEDGSIAIGDDGKQIKVAVSDEDTVDLYRENV